MASPLLTSPRLLFVIAVALLINSQMPASVGGLAGSVLKPIIDFAIMPLQAPLHRAAVKVKTAEPVADPAKPKTREELQLALDLSAVEIDRLQQRINELRRRLELIEGVEALGDTTTRPLSANVNRSIDTGPRPMLTIDRGGRDGVAAAMTVVYRDSVVGRVLGPVGPSTADVELITAHPAGFQVRARQPETGTVFDNLRAEPSGDGETFVVVVAIDSPIAVGADILLADAVHYADARGRRLGAVENITDHTPNPTLLQELIVRPAVDLRYLEQVAVLLPADDTPEQPQTGR